MNFVASPSFYWLRRMRKRRLSLAQTSRSRGEHEFDYEAAISFLGDRGCDQIQVREGSIPLSSLLYAEEFLRGLPADGRLVGLHVGNFVGVSLAFLTSVARSIHADSLIVSIDPNISHRGIRTPVDHALALLSRYQLNGNSVILTGYILEQSIANDGRDYLSGRPLMNETYSQEPSCTYQLQHLTTLGGENKFDFAVIDGNHEGPYLSREIAVIFELLRDGGLLILDDVDQYWVELRSVFASLENTSFKRIGADGRIGIAKKVS